MGPRKTRKISLIFSKIKKLKQSGREIAVAYLNDPLVKGYVIFTQVGDSVYIEAYMNELPSGHHGIHIHEFGNLLDGCTSLGAHWNPTGHDRDVVLSDVSSAIDLVAPGGLMILDDTNIDYISEIADACVSSGAFVEEKILDTIGYQHRILRRAQQ